MKTQKGNDSEARNLLLSPPVLPDGVLARRSRRLPLILLFCVLLAGAAFAQNASDTGSPTFSSSSELVLVPVQVRDSSGKAVRGLLQTDFVLRSDGKIQPVKIFEEFGGDSREQGPADSATAPEAHSAEEFSSVPDAGLPDQVLIIALDEVNTPFPDQTRARQELVKYFDKSRPGTYFTLVAITFSGLRQLQPLTSDPKVLLASVRGDQGKLGNVEQTHEGRFVPIAPLCHLCGNEIDAYKATADAKASDVTIQNFEQLEQAYAAFRGRKSVIFFSSGLHDQETISTILNRGNIALYPVDLKGAQAIPDTDPQADGQYLGEEKVDVTSIKSMYEPKKLDDTDMHGLATRTGGRYCTSGATLQLCMDQAVEDSNSYYLLGFYVPQAERVVGWHKLDVKLTAGHEKIHARSGYFLEAKSATTDSDIKKDLLAAASAQVGYTGVAFTVQKLPPPAATAASAQPPVTFRIKVPASSVVPGAGQQGLSYEIALIPLSTNGEAATDAQTKRLNLDAEQTKQAIAKGWRYDEMLTPASGVTGVKILVRDNNTGHIGSVTIPLGKQ